MRGVRSITLVAVLLAALLVSPSGAAQRARTSASALLTAGDAGERGLAQSRGTARRGAGGAVEAPGVTIRDGETVARSSVAGASARASAVARSVSLLGGRVTAYGVRRTVSATASGRVYSGRVEGLVVDGHALGASTGPRTYPLADGAGRVDVNRGASGLRLVLRSAAGGLPAGADVRVAVVGAAVKLLTPAPTPTPTATGTPQPATTATATPRARKPRRPAKPKERPVPARLLAGGFAFPVYGGARFSDTFGAARAAPIGSHQGIDIFAPFGSPVVAVADGRISRVGTLPISGNRLWLTTAAGDAFFYAHLSAFSPAAVDGARVKAGTVLGFAGNTGDAEPTPPHLHFEVHPGGEEEEPVNPYTVVTAWRARADVKPGAWLQRHADDATRRPGALVAVRDFIAE